MQKLHVLHFDEEKFNSDTNKLFSNLFHGLSRAVTDCKLDKAVQKMTTVCVNVLVQMSFVTKVDPDKMLLILYQSSFKPWPAKTFCCLLNFSSTSIYLVLPCCLKLMKMLSECHTAWIRMSG